MTISGLYNLFRSDINYFFYKSIIFHDVYIFFEL